MATNDSLAQYRAKRDFSQTPEPTEGGTGTGKALGFVIQKHAARNLHYDFRLELQGTLKSWAVPKGPSLDPDIKRMAVRVEDHPLAYADFEGTIPAKQYGAGDVIVWDRGAWFPIGDPVAGLESGKLKFELRGEKLSGGWTLVRMRGRGGKPGHEPWLLIKERDSHARPEQAFDVVEALPGSVLSDRSLPGKEAALPAAEKSKPGASKKNPEKKSAVKKPLSAKAGLDAPKGAASAALPETLTPQLAVLVNEAPADPREWAYEIKFDGYRLLARIDGASVRLLTRNGNDWTAKLAILAQAVASLGIGSGWLDGEIVVMNRQGVPDFGALQNAFDDAAASKIAYYVFDMPFHGGFDLRQVGLSERRELLRSALARNPQDGVVFSETFRESAQELLATARRIGLEGIIGKRKNSLYTGRRSADWIKLKTGLRQEFVIGGYTDPKGTRIGLGALLLGVHDADGRLRYAGNVGTGFDDETLRELKARLSQIHTDHAPFYDLPLAVKGRWVKPELVAEVAFGEWTHVGHIRHAVFQGLRADKPAQNITREIPVAPQSARKKSQAAAPALKAMRITHGERVVDASTGFTKKDLIDYYASVAELMLPHLKKRPLALVRAPAGLGGELFFQKHYEGMAMPGIKLLDPRLDPGHAPLLEIPSAQALLGAAQFNAVEFHTWNSTSDSIDQPDRMTFDLDPGEGVGWPEIQEGAQLVRTILDELGLAGFLKTSGGKGLHVVVPIKRDHGFDAVKDFSRAVVAHLVRVLPQRFVVKSGPQNRLGKIFVDYLRNGFGATTATAWSVRARPGMGVSVPVAWDELAALRGSAHWTATTLADRLKIGNQPWSDYESSRKGLTGAMKTLGFTTAA